MPSTPARWLAERLSQAVAGDVRVRAAFRRVTRRWRYGEHTIKRGPAAGLRIDLRGSRPSYVLGTAEQDVQDLLVSWLRPGQVFYDLGANVGFLTLLGARLVGAEGHVYAFEPSPLTAAALRDNVVRNGFTNVTVIEAAVGAEAGTARFDPVDAEASQFARLRHSGDGGIDVGVVSVDDVIRGGARPPDVVKIDVEGAENEALIGMRQTLVSSLAGRRLRGPRVAACQRAQGGGAAARGRTSRLLARARPARKPSSPVLGTPCRRSASGPATEPHRRMCRISSDGWRRRPTTLSV